MQRKERVPVRAAPSGAPSSANRNSVQRENARQRNVKDARTAKQPVPEALALDGVERAPRRAVVVALALVQRRGGRQRPSSPSLVTLPLVATREVLRVSRVAVARVRM